MPNIIEGELLPTEVGRIYRLNKTKDIRGLIIICWLAYFSTYLGRLNFSASMNEIINTGFLTKTGAGMIGTGFFFCYGFGQLISGFLGDRISSRWMAFTGLAGTAMINLVMTFVQSPNTMFLLWCINGLVQSLTWSPIIKILSVSLDREKCKEASIAMSTTVAAGTLSVYIMSALIIKTTSWRMVFFVAFLLISSISLLWLIGIGILERRREQQIHIDVKQQAEQEKITIPMWKLILSVGLIPIAISVIIQGILKDGVTAWVPTYVSEVFNMGSVSSILITTILPIVNLTGVYAANYMNKRIFRNEIATSGVCFAIVSIAILLLILFGERNMIIAVLLLALTTTGMIGVNAMLISLVPLYFSSMGKVSTITGMLNSMAYIGSSLSIYGIGWVSQNFGWNITMVLWFALAVLGVLVCKFSKNIWNNAITEKLKD